MMGSDGNFFPSLGMGFHDFAGSTVVHTIGGFIALAGSIVLGPRLGRKFKRDGGAPMLPHDLTIAVSGGLLLWFGWYGFNPGSTLSAMDFDGIGRVAANTTLAACAAGLSSIFYGYFMTKKWDAGFTTNGFLAGLVAITCPCYWVSPTGSVAARRYRRRPRDPRSRPARNICELTIPSVRSRFTGSAASGERFPSASSPAESMARPDRLGRQLRPAKGLFYGGGTQVLMAQVIGSAVVTAATFGWPWSSCSRSTPWACSACRQKRRLYGMDLHEHGISAYPEYEISALGAPSGMNAGTPVDRAKVHDGDHEPPATHRHGVTRPAMSRQGHFHPCLGQRSGDLRGQMTSHHSAKSTTKSGVHGHWQ